MLVGEYFRNIIDERLSSQERKPQVYIYQKDLLHYLREQDIEFELPHSNRRTSDAFKTGIEFLDGALNKPEYKAKTRLLAIYLWHYLFSKDEEQFSDKKLLSLLPCCLWVSTKNEEYYLTGSKLITAWFNSHISRSSCTKFGAPQITIGDLRESEMDLLTILDFKVITPGVMNQICLLRAEVLGETSTRYDSAAQKVRTNKANEQTKQMVSKIQKTFTV